MTPSLPSGDHILVVVDYYSRYMEVEVLKSTTADNCKVIASLRKIFLTHGLPVSITTDNGQQFISEEYCKFVKEERIGHRRVTPLWPQANGEVERQNCSLLKRIKIAQIEKRNWKEELGSFPIMYRTTHSTTEVSPAELLSRRKLRTRKPVYQGFNLKTPICRTSTFQASYFNRIVKLWNVTLLAPSYHPLALTTQVPSENLFAM